MAVSEGIMKTKTTL